MKKKPCKHYSPSEYNILKRKQGPNRKKKTFKLQMHVEEEKKDSKRNLSGELYLFIGQQRNITDSLTFL